MASSTPAGDAWEGERGRPPEIGSYILRSILPNVPLSAEGRTDGIVITCVELWNENLYVGTSAAEILHFVAIPPERSDPLGQSSYILASRQQPNYVPNSNLSQATAGIQQILVLPSVSKACVLCNGTLTFFSLPELSPAFGNNARFRDCLWVGGVDDGQQVAVNDTQDGVTIMICLRSRIRLFKIGDAPSKVRDIDFAGALTAVRRGNIACAADARSYVLLDVVRQVKNPLFAISSLDEETAAAIPGTVQDATVPERPSSAGRIFSASGIPATATVSAHDRSQARSTSLGNFASGFRRQWQESPRPESSGTLPEASGTVQRAVSPRPPQSPKEAEARDASLMTPERRLSSAQPAITSQKELRTAASKTFVPLKPHIAQPTDNEYLLVTGTLPNEPAVGMFVNTEGDVVRGTLEFRRYPDALLVDGRGIRSSEAPRAGVSLEEGYVLAVMNPKEPNTRKGIEIQKWDPDPSHGGGSKEWLEIDAASDHVGSGDEDIASIVGIRKAVTASDVPFREIPEILRLRHVNLKLYQSKEASLGDEPWSMREEEESRFIGRLSNMAAQILVWSASQIWWAVRTPMVMRLDVKLQHATELLDDAVPEVQPGRSQAEIIVNDIRSQEPRTELEFESLRYIRQKASLLLFADLLNKTQSGVLAFEHNKRFIEEALLESDLDPRVFLAFVPILRNEILEGPNGIWLPNGLKEMVEWFLQRLDVAHLLGDNLMHLVKRYLFVWRQKKGFGSVADEKEVFQTVDAALLHTLLLLDSQSPRGPAVAGSTRADLNNVADHGVDCFDRAVELLEQHKRLYILSRLYQSRRLPSKVLETWRRMIDGEPDEGGEFTDGEQEVRRYISKIRDPALVEEYAAWLANRNPKLGAQIFADDKSKVRFQPAQAVEILKEKAPGAVKDYLEHLHTQFVDELISFYLDTVLAELATSESSRATLLQSYETYRALSPPKPTYSRFIADNAIDAEWWHNRLRLLQLLGGSNGAVSQYDVPRILERIEPFKDALVPEMIILDGRRGRHEEAVRLLVNGLGDFDTAISYSLSGGSSIIPPSFGQASSERKATREEQAKLFSYLLAEFLRIEDFDARVERTSELLERFGGWFDVAHVLDLIPESWSVDLVAGFLISALRQLLRERNETSVAKALSGQENLRVTADFLEKVEALGPTIEGVR